MHNKVTQRVVKNIMKNHQAKRNSIPVHTSNISSLPPQSVSENCPFLKPLSDDVVDIATNRTERMEQLRKTPNIKKTFPL